MIETIDHQDQRYETVGDWKFDEHGDLHLWVSSMDNPAYEFLVGIHEAIEAMICKHRGISEKEITAFDVKFEQDREVGLHTPEDEPGMDPSAPYYDPHMIASAVERLLAPHLGVDDYDEYDKAVVSLSNGKLTIPTE